METSQDLHIFIIPCYHKRQIRFRAEVVDTTETTIIYFQDYNEKWYDFSYNNQQAAHNGMDFMEYNTEAEAIKAAQEFVEQLKMQ